MADVKFSEFPSASAADGVIGAVGIQNGTNVKFGAITNITTGGSTTTLNQQQLLTTVIEITSGGTAGVEVLDIITPAISAGVNPNFVGKILSVVFSVQTDPSDTIQLLNHGSNIWTSATPTGTDPWFSTNNLTLDYEGAMLTFRWDGSSWSVDNSQGLGPDPSTFLALRTLVPTGGTTGQSLVKDSDDDGDTEWAGGHTGDVVITGVGTLTFTEGRLTTFTPE